MNAMAGDGGGFGGGRRRFLGLAATAGAGAWLSGADGPAVWGQDEDEAGSGPPRWEPVPRGRPLKLAFIGVGGQGAANLKTLSQAGAQVAVLCDVDARRMAPAARAFPAAQRFTDFREIFARPAVGTYDGVVVSTPDHTHYHAAGAALAAGKACFCETPLAHSVWEARRLALLAERSGAPTQVNLPERALPAVHRVVEALRGDLLGKVNACHLWAPPPRRRPTPPRTGPKIPASLDWNLWLGPAPERRYHPSYLASGWRHYWDFGSGATGLSATPLIEISAWALDLTFPAEVLRTGPPPDAALAPANFHAHLKFPARPGRPPLDLHFHLTDDAIDVIKEHGFKRLRSGGIFLGEKGALLCNFKGHELYPRSRFRGVQAPRSIPPPTGLAQEWLRACQGGSPPSYPFTRAGPVAEAVLLANVAHRARADFKWDAENLDAPTQPRVKGLVRREYRSW